MADYSKAVISGTFYKKICSVDNSLSSFPVFVLVLSQPISFLFLLVNSHVHYSLNECVF